MVCNWYKMVFKIRVWLFKGFGLKDIGKFCLFVLNFKKGGKMMQLKLNWNGGQKVFSVSDVFQSEVDELDNDY